MRLSEEFHSLAHKYQHRHVTLKEILVHLTPRGQALVTLFLALPFAIFLPIPGLSIPFGIFIMLNGFRIAARKGVWVPKFLYKREISGSLLNKSFYKIEKLLKFLEKFVKPRGKFLNIHPKLQLLNGAVLGLAGFFLALPLPPGTNFLPGWTALIMSLGILEEDGVFVVIGYVLICLSIAFFVLLPIVGLEKFHEFFH